MTGAGTVLITGANRGLGLGLAREFARRGWRVFGGCRRLDATVDLVRLEPAGVETVGIDVRDSTSIAAACRRVKERAGRIDVLVNNAGINPAPRDAGVGEVPVDLVAEALDVNVVGALRMLQAAAPLLRRSEAPRVVNISSGAGSLAHNPAIRPQPAYCISKAALNMLTRRAARDLPGITVVSVSPGWIRTDMGGADAALDLEEAAGSLVETILALTPGHTGQWLDRFGRISEYAW